PSTIPRRSKDGVPPRPEAFPTPQAMTGAPADDELPFGGTGPPKGWHESEAELLVLLDLVATRYRTDPARVYLTGLSYGGFGTWYLASKHPERFAAMAPVAGWGHPELIPPLARRRLPVWAFAGGRDPAILVQHFYPGLNALEARGHDDVRFTVREDRGHDVWRRVYASSDLYDWLLSHRLPEDP
ncbi:MAG: prolyl oligopeptidase family serine peptidase, partial [Acidobacteriota bacterium]